MNFLQKKRDSKRNLFLKIKNIICYYQTKRNCIKLTLTIISKHHMLLPNPGRNDIGAKAAIYFKTSYVITKLNRNQNRAVRDTFQNIICYYQTGHGLSESDYPQHISKHHMLLPNKIMDEIREGYIIFQNIICYYQTHGFKPSFNPLIPWKPLNHGIFFKFYQPTPNFRNDS